MSDKTKLINKGIKLTIEGWYYIPAGMYKIFYIALISKVLGDKGLYIDALVASALYFLAGISELYTNSTLKLEKKSYDGFKLLSLIIAIYGIAVAIIFNSVGALLLSLEFIPRAYRDIIANDLIREGKYYKHLYMVRGSISTTVLYIAYYAIGIPITIDMIFSITAIVDTISNLIVVYIFDKRLISEMFVTKTNMSNEVKGMIRAINVSFEFFLKTILMCVVSFNFTKIGFSAGMIKEYSTVISFRDVIRLGHRIPIRKDIQWDSTRLLKVKTIKFFPYIVSLGLLLFISSGGYFIYSGMSIRYVVLISIVVVIEEIIWVYLNIYKIRIMLNPKNKIKATIIVFADIVPTIFMQYVLRTNIEIIIILQVTFYFVSLCIAKYIHDSDIETVNEFVNKNIRCEI